MRLRSWRRRGVYPSLTFLKACLLEKWFPLLRREISRPYMLSVPIRLLPWSMRVGA
jgi:hypothetical protein